MGSFPVTVEQEVGVVQATVKNKQGELIPMLDSPMYSDKVCRICWTPLLILNTNIE